MSGLRIIISGGGTGGHIFPAIAIANAIVRKNKEAEILFVGATGRMEMEKVPHAGYKITGLNISGYQRGSLLKNLSLPFKILSSLLKALMLVRSFRPQVAVGVGGYASGPTLRAANFMGVPTVIQEQNSFAGITNKLLAKSASAICTAYVGMEKVFPREKIVLTGNPVRQEILTNVNRAGAMKYFGLEDGRKTILVVGGSLGARTLNQSVESSAEQIKTSGAQVLWQTGGLYYETFKHVADGIPNLKVVQFIDRMDYAYACADVVISRAGALSIAELQLLGKPSILVPSPNVAEDHQTSNAMALVNSNAAIMIKDSEAKPKLFSAAFDLLSNDGKRKELGENIRQMGIPDAAERIADEVLKVAKTK